MTKFSRMRPALILGGVAALLAANPAQGACTAGSGSYAGLVTGTYGVSGYWRLGESRGKTACAAVGRAGSYRAGTKLGAAGALAGDGNRAAGLPGKGGATLPGPAPAGQAAVDGWFRFDRGSGTRALLAGGGIALGVDPSGRLVLRRGRSAVVTSSRKLAARRWHHVALSVRDGRATLYADGRAAGTGGTGLRLGGSLQVGRGGGMGALRGAADDVAVYSRPLAAAEVALHRRTGVTAFRGPRPVVAAAGDIACESTDPNYNGGAGTADRCQQGATAAQVTAPGIDAVLALGDEQYESGSLAEFNSVFAQTWGRAGTRLHPVPGNHEYLTAGAAGYWDYFNGPGAATGPAGQRGQGWYSFDLGPWHLAAVNSNCAQVDCGVGSAQAAWLAADLEANRSRCTMVFEHQPLYSSSRSGNDPSVENLFKVALRSGADLLLSAHHHAYERFAPQGLDARLRPADGLREIVVGTGGEDMVAAGPIQPNSEARGFGVFGVVRLTLDVASYSWQFQPIPGQRFTDAGTQACH